MGTSSLKVDLTTLTTRLIANVPNIQMKTQRVSDWIKKQDLSICSLQKAHLKYPDPKVKQCKKINCVKIIIQKMGVFYIYKRLSRFQERVYYVTRHE